MLSEGVSKVAEYNLNLGPKGPIALEEVDVVVKGRPRRIRRKHSPQSLDHVGSPGARLSKQHDVIAGYESQCLKPAKASYLEPADEHRMMWLD